MFRTAALIHLAREVFAHLLALGFLASVDHLWRAIREHFGPNAHQWPMWVYLLFAALIYLAGLLTARWALKALERRRQRLESGKALAESPTPTAPAQARQPVLPVLGATDKTLVTLFGSALVVGVSLILAWRRGGGPNSL